MSPLIVWTFRIDNGAAGFPGRIDIEFGEWDDGQDVPQVGITGRT